MQECKESAIAVTGSLAEMFVSIQGEGPWVGRRHLFVRLSGCRIGCRYCDTPEALGRQTRWRVHPPGGDPAGAAGTQVHDNPTTAKDVIRQIDQLARNAGPIQAVAVTGGEPLEQPGFLARLLPLIEQPVLLETAGTLPDALESVIDAVTLVSMDLKLPSVARIEVDLERQRRFLGIARRRQVSLKAVVSERLVESEWHDVLAMVARTAPDAPLIIQPETRRDGGLAAGLPLLNRLLDLALAAGLTDVRILPQVHKVLGAP